MNSRIVLHILVNDSTRRARLARLAFNAGFHAEIYGTLDELSGQVPSNGLVLIEDEPGQGTVPRLITELADRGSWLPVVAIGEKPETSTVVSAIKGGALDYLALPLDADSLTGTVNRVMAEAEGHRLNRVRAVEARTRIARLSAREREVLDRLANGFSNKAIARELDISPRTVEIHRMKMMGKLGARHSAEAVRLRLVAAGLDEVAA